MKFNLCLFVFLLVGLNCVLAQKLNLMTEGFELADEDRKTITILSRYEASLYNLLFGTNKNDTLQIPITFYKREAEYAQACREAGMKYIPGTGVYFPAKRHSYIYKSTDFINVAVHEMGHAFMHHNLESPPRWVNEGISQFFESLAVENRKVFVQPHYERIRQVRAGLETRGFDFRNFLKLNDNNAWGNKKQIGYMYTVSYSIVYFIMRSQPEKLVELMSAFTAKKDSIAAIESVYGSVQTFEQAYSTFYRYFKA